MNAGFLRRSMSSIADFIFIITLVFFAFNAIAKPIYRSQVDNFDELYDRYQVLQTEKSIELKNLENTEYDIRLVPTMSAKQIADALAEIEEQRIILLDEYEAISLNPDLDETERTEAVEAWEEDMATLDFREEMLGFDDQERLEALEDIDEQRRLLNLYYSDINFPDVYRVGDAYVLFLLLFSIIGFSFFHIGYMLILKGHSFGRRLFRLKLSGNINFLSLILREFFWKYVYWVLTFGIGIIIDVYMCILTPNRKVPRDYFSKTRVILDDIVYPF